MSKKHAVALRAFDHLDDSYTPGPAFQIEAGHFADWSAAGLVREATAAEVAKVKGEAPARRAPAPRTGKKPAAASAAASATADAAQPDTTAAAA